VEHALLLAAADLMAREGDESGADAGSVAGGNLVQAGRRAASAGVTHSANGDASARASMSFTSPRAAGRDAIGAAVLGSHVVAGLGFASPGLLSPLPPGAGSRPAATPATPA
jgi:hypothetical protein